MLIESGTNKTRGNSKNKEKVLITGAAGFIGSHLIETLIKKGYDVVGLLMPADTTRWIKNLDATFIYGDITNKDSLYKAVSGTSYIYHLAALLRSPDPKKFYQINYEGTKNLVDVCLDLGIKPKRFLFASSVEVIGPTAKNETLNEAALCNPVTDYGKSKLLAEQYLFSVKERLPFTIVRLPLVYGPRNLGAFFNLFKLLNKGIRIKLFDVESNLAFVQDIVDGIILASENSHTLCKTFLLGENRIYTSNEILTIIEKVLGKKTIKLKIPYSLLYLIALFCEMYAKITNTQAFIIRQILKDTLKLRYSRFDMSKAEREFGFKAKTPFEIGAKITADWYKKEGFI